MNIAPPRPSPVGGRVFGIIRERDPMIAVAVAVAARAGGIRAMEVSLVTPGAGAVVGELVARFRDTTIGAGTVLTAADAQTAIDAGARFVVSPAFDTEVLEACRDRGIAYYPGVLTPQEVWNATRSGASAVKVFPVNAMNDDYIRDLRAPFPQVAMIAVGGIDVARGRRHLAHGAVAIGVGSPLFITPEGARTGDSAHLAAITRAAERFAALEAS
ncbi:bifunctional 4-hydroxy-2-oxoglutarate aldolase/2-dehydro-3-deoxy-phosphogluconate aldolase [Microbacterium sp. BK668]|uniref:bifunctional 4-hydroxy-2-oxoglutarate aldolase/2-dehydro-3-deoxy-phosphogluconate aldolase n=1 Tax=Microbacterium sp. BK668 TaxID=2512118 RepID=UPI001060220E|nr:bifunctional 4-hydroxy-2-oxoglutarate aldolase/2-dehydro-3-deoxy-phosphogluconate aldolase [Microbacterium sp. BK668]TDN91554.1 2-dehydro-3-deoxyphosphogluconate aldolase/(4S)-4-hydroxy-2-oxoglutarate aldolase [Microbacterium sp. BK668]